MARVVLRNAGSLAHGQRARAFMLIVPGRCKREECNDGTGHIDVGSFLR